MSGDVVRSRILRQLDNRYSLTVVEGMPGAGKTTVVRQWYSRIAQDLPAVWLETKAAHTHGGVFVAELRRSLAQAAGVEDPGSGSVSDLARDLPAGCVVVIDDADPIAGLHASLELVDLAVVAGVSVVVMGVDLHALRVLAEHADVGVEVVGGKDLVFAVGEVGELLALHGVEDRDGSLAVAVQQVCVGGPWVLGQVVPELCLDPGRDLREYVVPAFARYEKVLIDWIVAADLSGGFLGFMRGAIVTPALTSDLATTLMPGPRTESHLHRIARSGLASWQYNEALGEATLQWSFESARSRVIRSSLAAPHAPDYAALAAVASQWWQQHGDDASAVDVLLGAGLLAQGETFVGAGAWVLDEGGLERLAAGLRRLPTSVLQEHPVLAHLLVLRRAQVDGVTEPMERRLRRGLEIVLAATRGTDLVRMARAGAIAATTFAVLGDRDRATKAVRDTLELAEPSADGSGESVRDSLASSVTTLGLAAFQCDDQEGWDRSWALALDLVEHEEHRLVEVVRGYSAAGNAVGAPDGSGRSIVPTGRSRHIVSAVAEAWLALDRWDAEAAMEASARAVQQVARPEQWPRIVAVRAISLLAGGQPEEARAAFMSWSGSTAVRTSPYFRFVGVLCALSAGRLREARERVQAPRSSTSVYDRMADAMVLMADGALDAAGLAMARPDTEEIGFVRARVAEQALLAALATRQGRPALALQHLHRAFDLAGSPASKIGFLVLSAGDLEQIGALSRTAGAEAIAADVAGVPIPRPVLPDGRTTVALTEREREVFGLLATGLSNGQVAGRLVVSINTVKFHRASLYRKLGVTGLDEALAAARTAGIRVV